MAVRVAFVCFEREPKLWVREVVEWKRPLPRLGEAVLFTAADFAEEDGNEAIVGGVVWPIESSTLDVFLVICTPFDDPDGREDQDTTDARLQKQLDWLVGHGFSELLSAQDVETYVGFPGVAELLRPHYEQPQG